MERTIHPTMDEVLRAKSPRSSSGNLASTSDQQSFYGPAQRSRDPIRPPLDSSEQTLDQEPLTHRERGGCHRVLTSPEQPKPAAYNYTPTTLPSPPSSLHSHPLQPIHRACRGPLFCRPHTPHTSLLLPLIHPTIPTMAPTTSTPPHPTSHLPLPQLSLLQCSLCQTLLQPHHPTALLPPTRPLLHRLYWHRHPAQGTQPSCQTQTIAEQHPHFSGTLPSLLALPQQHPPLHTHSTFLT